MAKTYENLMLCAVCGEESETLDAEDICSDCISYAICYSCGGEVEAVELDDNGLCLYCADRGVK